MFTFEKKGNSNYLQRLSKGGSGRCHIWHFKVIVSLMWKPCIKLTHEENMLLTQVIFREHEALV